MDNDSSTTMKNFASSYGSITQEELEAEIIAHAPCIDDETRTKTFNSPDGDESGFSGGSDDVDGNAENVVEQEQNNIDKQLHKAKMDGTFIIEDEGTYHKPSNTLKDIIEDDGTYTKPTVENDAQLDESNTNELLRIKDEETYDKPGDITRNIPNEETEQIVKPINDVNTQSQSVKMDGTFSVDGRDRRTSLNDVNQDISDNRRRTFTVDDDDSVAKDITDRKVQPKLNETFDNDDKQLGDNKEDKARERNHLRRRTVTLSTNGVNQEVIDLVNEIIAENPHGYLEVLQKRLSEYAIEKEKSWKQEYQKQQNKVDALFRIKLNKLGNEIQKEQQQKTNKSGQIDPKLEFEMECAVRERDAFKDQLYSQCRTMKEQMRNYEFFTEKAQRYNAEIERLKSDQKQCEDSVKEIYDRYEGLLREVEQQTVDIEEEIAYLKEKHDGDTVSLRYKTRQQEMKLNSLNQQVQTLAAEKQELIQMCDELVEQLERAKIQYTDEVSNETDITVDNLNDPTADNLVDGEAFFDNNHGGLQLDGF